MTRAMLYGNEVEAISYKDVRLRTDGEMELLYEAQGGGEPEPLAGLFPLVDVGTDCFASCFGED